MDFACCHGSAVRALPRKVLELGAALKERDLSGSPDGAVTVGAAGVTLPWRRRSDVGKLWSRRKELPAEERRNEHPKGFRSRMKTEGGRRSDARVFVWRAGC